MIYLLDTDTIIHSVKRDPVVMDNFRRNASSPMLISAITYGKLFYGAEQSKFVDKNLATVQRIAEIFPIVDVTKPIMETFGRLKAHLTGIGKVLDDMDLLIASTALANNYTLVSNNEKHFRKIPQLYLANWRIPPARQRP
jgi:tRNA(fMet)-specific endonuclease VapC